MANDWEKWFAIMEGVSTDPEDRYARALELPRRAVGANGRSPLQNGSGFETHPYEGRKDDAGKVRFDLLPPDALWEVVRVYTVGCARYGDRNWEQGIKWGRVFAAICRHLFSWWRGEQTDQETGISHLAHAAWGCLALLAYELRGMTDFDERKIWPK